MFAGLAVLIAYLAGLIALFGGGEPLGGLALLVPGLLVGAFIYGEDRHGG